MHQRDPAIIENKAFIVEAYEAVGDIQVKKGDTKGAFENYRRALEISESWAADNIQTSVPERYMARQATKIAGLYALLASRSKDPMSQQRANWHEARAWYERSLNLWREIQKRGQISAVDSESLNASSLGLIRSNTALKQP